MTHPGSIGLLITRKRVAEGELQTLRIPASPREVSRARRWFRGCLRRAHWPDEGAQMAEQVFAELAANAVVHTRGTVTFKVQVCPDAVRCDIRDSSWRSPRPADLWSPCGESGRGMAIVTALADAWGVRRHLLGKTVWFEAQASAAGLT